MKHYKNIDSSSEMIINEYVKEKGYTETWVNNPKYQFDVAKEVIAMVVTYPPIIYKDWLEICVLLFIISSSFLRMHIAAF